KRYIAVVCLSVCGVTFTSARFNPRIGLTQAFADALDDPRDPDRTEHTSPDAYEKLVERLLASPRYGEKMANLWLDLARFGDTSGYEYDSTRQMWMWRDWVINAANRNLPMDESTIQPLAADLLPKPTTENTTTTVS